MATKKRISLQDFFDSNFHGKYDFADFLSTTPIDETRLFSYDDKRVAKPSEKLKAYHRLLKGGIFEHGKISEDVVFSYRKEKNVYHAVAPHARSRYFFQTDIKNFFSSITRKDIHTVIRKNTHEFPVFDVDIHEEQIIKLVTLEDRLPIGFSTSPILSNLCLYDFDEALEEYCHEKNIVYTRYSDDLILSAPDVNPLKRAHAFICHLLDVKFEGRMSLNEKKTKINHKGNKIKILGVVVLPNGTLTIDSNTKKTIEALLYFYLNDRTKFQDLSQTDYDAALAKVSGMLNYINTIDQLYLNKLRKKYGNTVVDMFFHKTAR